MSIREERKRQSHQAIIDAALRLCTTGRSFNSITLREISREVGLVPSAFYRHFADTNALGLEIIDKVSIHFKSILHQLGQAYLYQDNPDIEKSFELFFSAVEQHQEEWIFLISERWGGSDLLRQAIAREVEYLIEDLTIHLKRIPSTAHIKDENELKILADLLINLTFHWAITWINNIHRYPPPHLEAQQILLKQQANMQLKMMFDGFSNWKN